MAEICILYAHEDRNLSKLLNEALSTTHSVWWDDQIHAGDYRAEIESQITKAKCVIPMWSRHSRVSPNVVDEVTFAKSLEKKILPVKLEDIQAPLGFGGLHTVDFSGWNGDVAAACYRDLYRNLSAALGNRTVSQRRLFEWKIGDKTRGLPLLFFSISSFETAVAPDSAAQAVALYCPEAALFSAYDVFNTQSDARSAAFQSLEEYRSNGGLVALDSGNYEAARKRDSEWKAEFFHEALAMASYDFSFSFDEVLPTGEVPEIVRTVCMAVERDRRFTSKPIIPIVHAPTDSSTGCVNSALLPQLMQDICRELNPPLIAVPERELGDGLFRRAEAVHKIRRSLDDLGFYQPLHLLGTGNPLSTAVFAAAGADTFDGLEWCRTVIDEETGRLYHLQQYDLFSFQTAYAESPIVRESATLATLAYNGKVIFHNLDTFSTWMKQLRKDLQAGKVERFLATRLPYPKSNLSSLETAVPGVFD